MAKKTKKKIIRKKSASAKQISVLAISALVLNLLLPGLGSIIGNRVKTGIYQLVLIAFALTAAIFFPGWIVFCILWAIAWVWAIITGIQLIKS